MAKLYIHIGTHKTGSSAIQRTIQENSKRLIRHKIIPVPFLSQAKKLMGNGVFDEKLAEQTDSYFRNFINNCDRQPNSIYVISSEAFSGNPNIGYNNAKVIAKTLHTITADFDVYIVVYLRRQDTFVESLYTQMIQQGDSYDFLQFLQDFDHHPFDWLSLLDSYAEYFGQDHILVRSYEKCIHEKGSVVADFFDILEYNGRLSTPKGRINASYSRSALELARICNPALSVNEKKTVRQILQRIAPKPSSEAFSFFTPEEREKFVIQYEPSNREVARRYMHSNDSLFPPIIHSGEKANLPGKSSSAEGDYNQLLVMLLKELAKTRSCYPSNCLFCRTTARIRKWINPAALMRKLR